MIVVATEAAPCRLCVSGVASVGAGHVATDGAGLDREVRVAH